MMNLLRCLLVLGVLLICFNVASLETRTAQAANSGSVRKLGPNENITLDDGTVLTGKHSGGTVDHPIPPSPQKETWWLTGLFTALQIIFIHINWWAYNSYYMQPKSNHPRILWNPIARKLLLTLPWIGIIGLVTSAFFFTSYPWLFLLLSISWWTVMGYRSYRSLKDRSPNQSVQNKSILKFLVRLGIFFATITIVYSGIVLIDVGLIPDAVQAITKAPNPDGRERHMSDPAIIVCSIIAGILFRKIVLRKTVKPLLIALIFYVFCNALALSLMLMGQADLAAVFGWLGIIGLLGYLILKPFKKNMIGSEEGPKETE